MEGATHILGGAVAGMLCTLILQSTGIQSVGLVGVSIAGSLFPDVDLCSSKAGSKAKPASFTINKLFGHRTLFHSPILYAALYLLWTHYFPNARIWAVAFAVGVASHILLDMFNKRGIPLLYPIKKTYHITSIKNGSTGEIVFRVILGIIAFVGFAFYLSFGSSILTV